MKAAVSRRAKPLLGTLVEVGGAGDAAALQAAFDAVAEVQAALSRFEPGSDVARFNALAAGQAVDVGADAVTVLAAAQRLALRSRGRFDVALGSGRWRLAGRRLLKLDPGVALDLGGIAKGHAVDRGIAALQAAGCSAGWVNAGGDLRVYGDLPLALQLRDEDEGGVRPFGTLRDAAFATSRLGRERHLSVQAPSALWADALTKALTPDDADALLPEFGAQAWWH